MVTAKISLVIPCWHAAKHLPHVLEDLQAQTFTDFEAILVNDGDDSQVEAMEDISAKDDRIHIVRLEKNSGVAAARNAGTDIAQAPWVGYADPDDRFGPHYLQSLYEPVEKLGGVELVCGGFTFHYVRTGKRQPDYFQLKNSPQVMDFAKAYEMMHSAFADGMLWNKLYNRDIMQRNEVRYDENMRISEDQAFNHKYYQFTQKIGMVRNCEYEYYIYGGETVSHSYDPLFMKNLTERIALLETTYQRIGWPDKKIREQRNKVLTYESFRMCSTLYSSRSPLNFGSAATKVQEDILNQPEIVSAILEGNYQRDRMIRLHQWLIRQGNARLMAFTYKILWMVKSRFGNIYAKIKPFIRGDI